MEINATKFIVKHSDCMNLFSDSIANSGLDNIGQLTWQNACVEMADEANWFTTDLQALVDHFRGYGAWDADELNSMCGKELNALLAQFIAGTFQERERARERGALALQHYESNYGGNLVQGDDGGWYFYLDI